MGLTVEQVIERAYDEILHAGGQARPAWDVLEGAINSSVTSMVLEGRQSHVPPDGLLEFWDSTMEIVEVKSVSSTTVTLQTRGYLGTTAGSHDDGTKVVIDNPYPRQVLLNGLKAVIGILHGYGLYTEAYSSALTYSAIAPVELPSGATDVVAVNYQSGTQWYPLTKGTHFRLLQNYGLTSSSPPAIHFYGGTASQGAAMKVIYRKEYTLPSALTDDFDTLGVPSSLQHHLATGLAGHVLMGRDVPYLESEYVPPDPRDPQVGSKLNVGRALWSSFIENGVLVERNRLLTQNPTIITHERT